MSNETHVAAVASKSPAATWKRHRDTFSPNLPDQFSTAPNGVRYAPTFYAPRGGVGLALVTGGTPA